MSDPDLLNQLNIYKSELLSILIDRIDENQIKIKEIGGKSYLSYTDVIRLITETKPEIKD